MCARARVCVCVFVIAAAAVCMCVLVCGGGRRYFMFYDVTFFNLKRRPRSDECG